MAQKFTVPVTIKNLSSAGSDGLTVFLDQESFARLKVEAGGRITWGAGSGAGDTNLYRDAESVLKTDDTFKAAGLYVAGTQIDPTGATVGDALIFNGTKFVSASVADGGATLTVSDTAPEDPSLGDLWFNSTDLEIYVYYSSSWIQVTDSSPGVQELYELVDVLIDNPVSGETLVYNGTEWVNEIAPAGTALSLETARAISISGDASGSVLFDGSQDVNITASVRFISGTEIDPSGATVGDALVFNGTKFVSASVAGGGGASLTVSDTPPPGASEGDLWFRSDTANTYVYYDSSWVEIGASGGVATLDDIGNVSASAPASGDFLKWNGSAWVNDSIDLGSETNGIYVADLVAGTGVTITNGASESASPTIAIGQSVGTTASVTFANVTADLIGNVTGNLTGDVTGNADTAASLETSRTIALSGDVSGSVSFDGSASVSITTTIQPNSVALGTDTTGDYIASLVAGTNISISNNSGEGATPTISVSGSVSGVDSISGVDFVQFDTTANTTPVTGLLGWDSVEGTLNLGLSTGKHIHVGEESVFRVRNSTGAVISKGTALYASGVEPSGRIQVTPYVADGSVREVRFMGLATESINNGVNGFVQHFGYVRDLDTRGTSSTSISVGDETWAAGDILYVHPTAPGKLTNIAPRHAIIVAILIVRHATTGILFVRPSSGGHIEDIHDVVLTSPADGQFLRYNSASTVWVNDTINLGTDTVGNYLSDLTQGTGVTITHTPSEGSNATIAIGQAVDTSASVTFAQVNTTGDVVVGGNLTVNGTTTTLNTETLSIEDNIVVLNSNVTGSPTTNAGMEVERGTSTNVSVRWNETTDTWEFTNDGSIYGNIAALGAIALGTDTTGNYMSDVSAGTGISVSHTPGEGSSATVSLNATLDDLSNVTATSPADGNFLKYVSASSSWVPAAIPTINALDDIGDVSVASPTVGHYLQWSGSAWTSASVSGGSTVTASTTPPSSPTSGSIWFDSGTAKTYVYYDSFWVEIGGTSGGAKMYVDLTAPSAPLEGQLWFKSDTAQTFAYYDSSWIEVGAAGMSAIAADVAPASPVAGQIWFDTDSGATYVYYDSYWIEVGAVAANTIFNLVDAKGDILVGTADNVLARQAVGTDGQLLQANSATTNGLQWFTPTYAPSASPTFTGTVVLPSTTSIGTVTSTEIGYVDGVTSAIQTQLDSKAPLAGPTFTGTVVLPSTTSIGTITSTELGYVDGVTSAIQTQLNAKAPLASPTFTGTPFFNGGTLGGTAGNSVETYRGYAYQSNTEQIKTRITKTSTGGDWTTSAWTMQRVVDSTEMGYIKLGYGIVALGDGTTDSLIVDSSGRVRTPSQPAFSAYNTNAASGGQDIVFATTSVNAGSCYNTSNGRFTAPVAGSYWFAYQALQQNGNTGEYRHALYKNGSGYGGLRFIFQKDVASWQSTYAYGVVYLAANDYVTLRYESGTGTMYTDGNYSNFSGYLIG